MAITLTPEQGHSGGYTDKVDYSQYNYSYDYPRRLDLKPGSEIHELIKSRVLQRARSSFSVMQRRHPTWNKIDDMLNVYIETDELEEKLKNKDARKPVSIVVPYSFAVLETLLTYMVGAFFQDPIFQYEGAGPEDTIGATLLMLCIDHQMRRSGGALALHTMFRDGLSYGIGPVAAGWKVVHGNRVVKEQETFASRLGRLFNLGGARRKTVPSIFYEGGDLINLDPYLILPDTNVPIHKAGDGEFFGWIEYTPLPDLQRREAEIDSQLFNVKYVRHLSQRQTEFTIDPSRRGYKEGMNERHQLFADITNSKTIVNMYVDLVPADWKLGPSENPEKWMFKVADSEIVIMAQPMDLVHNSYPVVLAAPDYDGYSVAPVSRIEMVYGLQHVMNFLFNSHVANVRRSINNMLVVDPSMVNMPDFEDPSGGLLVRLRRAAWGRGVKDVVEQLAVSDVTKNNIQDAFSIIDFINRVSGANENAMGIMRRGSERRSATEARGALNATMSRMERLAKMISIQAMQPLAHLLAFHTQQLMSKETYVKITGEWASKLGVEYGTKQLVDPLDLLVEFDTIVRDGTLPIDTSGMIEFWTEALQIVSKSETLMNEIDTTRVFMHIARLSGAKNVQDFIRQGGGQMQVQPNEQVASQAQAGNVVALPTAMSAAGAM